VAESFDISELANSVYEHNFSHPTSIKSIERLSAEYIDSLNVDTWLMSPPCQPYTSQGLQEDDKVSTHAHATPTSQPSITCRII
jgi:tRNA (cytosine38-C5)-methyltransferase